MRQQFANQKILYFVGRNDRIDKSGRIELVDGCLDRNVRIELVDEGRRKHLFTPTCGKVRGIIHRVWVVDELDEDVL